VFGHHHLVAAIAQRIESIELDIAAGGGKVALGQRAIGADGEVDAERIGRFRRLAERVETVAQRVMQLLALAVGDRIDVNAGHLLVDPAAGAVGGAGGARIAVHRTEAAARQWRCHRRSGAGQNQRPQDSSTRPH